MSILLHTALGVAALAFGAAVVVRRKGTGAHRWTGRAYAAAMLTLCVSSFWVPAEVGPRWGRFGVFHGIAVLGVVHLALGVGPVLWRGAVPAWVERHLYFTLWSFVGLVMATLSHVFGPVAGALAGAVGLTPAAAGWATAALLWGVPVVVGTVLIERLRGRVRRGVGAGPLP